MAAVWASPIRETAQQSDTRASLPPDFGGRTTRGARTGHSSSASCDFPSALPDSAIGETDVAHDLRIARGQKGAQAIHLFDCVLQPDGHAEREETGISRGSRTSYSVAGAPGPAAACHRPTESTLP